MATTTVKKTPIQRTLDAFPDAKPSGNAGWFSAKCTGHNDKHASLSFRETESGGVVFKCHAQGCSREAILQGADFMESTYSLVVSTGPNSRPVLNLNRLI